MRKNWYREIHGKTRNRLTYKLPPTDDAMRRDVQTSQSISLMRISPPPVENGTRDSVIGSGELSNRSEGKARVTVMAAEYIEWNRRVGIRVMTRRSLCFIHEAEEKLRMVEWRMMNDETEKENAVEQRQSTLIGYKQRLSPIAAT